MGEKKKDHFWNMYNDQDNTVKLNNHPIVIQRNDGDITEEEVQWIVTELTNRQGPGMDGITKEMLKYTTQAP